MRKKVLLIDDDPDEAELFKDVLADIDPTISYHYCFSGKSALASLTEGKVNPDIIFLDINMPEMDGWECVRNLKSIPVYKDIPVYMYSTSKRESDRAAARKMGAIDLITKATNYRKFKDEVAAILNDRSTSSFIRTGPRILILSLMRYWRNSVRHAFTYPFKPNFQ